MKQTLLEMAKQEPVKNMHSTTITDEEIELAMAWATDQVTLGQVAAVVGKTGKSSNNTYNWLALLLREMIRKNMGK